MTTEQIRAFDLLQSKINEMYVIDMIGSYVLVVVAVVFIWSCIDTHIVNRDLKKLVNEVRENKNGRS